MVIDKPKVCNTNVVKSREVNTYIERSKKILILVVITAKIVSPFSLNSFNNDKRLDAVINPTVFKN